MPWCASCDRFLTPSTVRADGTCPRCGRAIEQAVGDAGTGATTEVGVSTGPDEEPLDPLPWHFKLLLGAIALYLGYRAFQGIEWLVGQV